MLMSRSQVEAIGGPPSAKLFSTYTDICNLLTRIDDLPHSPGAFSGGYYTRTEEQLVAKLKSKVDEFKNSRHTHATGIEAQAKKKRETQAVDALDNSMQDEVLYARISKLLNDNAGSSIPLVRNSVAGWIRRFQHEGASIGIAPHVPRINAQWTGKCLQIKPVAFFPPLDPTLPLTLLVHEYHHVLTKRAEPQYNDEFVAHWKQYTVGRVAPLDDVGRANRINNFLLDDLNGYRFPEPAQRLTRPQDAGKHIWDVSIENRG